MLWFLGIIANKSYISDKSYKQIEEKFLTIPTDKGRIDEERWIIRTLTNRLIRKL